MAWVKLARHVVAVILYGILFTIVPARKIVAGILLQGYDQCRIDMQQRVKELSDAGLNEAIEDLDQHRPWHGKAEELRKELEKAGLLSIALTALEDEKFLREYDRER